ncbi:hypothetical protein MRX96_006289 [Rhipicephalus microplus]
MFSPLLLVSQSFVDYVSPTEAVCIPRRFCCVTESAADRPPFAVTHRHGPFAFPSFKRAAKAGRKCASGETRTSAAAAASTAAESRGQSSEAAGDRPTNFAAASTRKAATRAAALSWAKDDGGRNAVSATTKAGRRDSATSCVHA